jgi:hypothetical protein
MLLVLTFSQDVTFDLLQTHLHIPFFRFNIDLWKEYEWNVTEKGYFISDRIGRVCCEKDVRAVYLRKLIFDPPYIDIPAGGSEEAWHRAQLVELFRGIRDLAYAEGKLALVWPSRACSKIRQMRLASRYFPVPPWDCFHGKTGIEGSLVIKTFAALPTQSGAHVFVKRVDPTRLSRDYSWFLQQEVLNATHDVTVVFVAGAIFAYETPRLEGQVDVRTDFMGQEDRWRPCKISEADQSGIRNMMAELDLNFGRFDFLKAENKLWFLEINPNGQWAWLDGLADNGLIQHVAKEIESVWQSNLNSR